MISYPPPHGIPQEVPNQPIRIRVDNLPPAKNWRQIRGFLAKFIPYEQVLNVKVLPLMPSMTPPFIPLQSCIVLLRQDTDWPNLLMQLNGIEWDYHTIMAVILPYFIMPESAALRAAPVGPFIHGAHSAPGSSDVVHSPMLAISKHVARHEHPYERPHRHGGRLPVHPPFMGPGVPALIHNGQVQQHSSRRLTQIFNEASFRRQMSQRNMYQLQISNFPPCLHWDEVIKTTATDPPKNDPTSLTDSEREETGSLNGSTEGGNVKQKSAEHQQHPSMVAPQPHVLQDENNEIVPDLTIMTSHPEKYGKLKWTILKDFVKLKCPKLLEMDHKSQGTALSNTREFYVGVYEDSESHVEIVLLPNGQPDQIIEGPLSEEQVSELPPENLQRFKVRATLFQAVIGFHSKELCDLCLQAINGEEYMLGYKLKVHKLAKINSV